MDSKLQDVIRKVESLLERAANTDFPEEAESCQAKAQELITKYQVETSLLFGSSKKEGIIRKSVVVSPPYVIDKIGLLNAIARENFCKVLRGRNYAVIFGYETDIELALTMYRMLLVHMVSEMTKELDLYKAVGKDLVGWKKSFFAGYASTIGKRLKNARNEHIDSVSRSVGNDKFALVVKSKQTELEEYWKGVSRITTPARHMTSSEGYYTGVTSGNSADIGQSKVSGQKAIGS